MAVSPSKYSIDMCHGPLFSKIVMFSIPLFLAGLLQLTFHLTDMVVLGQFATTPGAFAAVTATASITVLFINVFMGLSVGANVIIARYYGARDSKLTRRAAHTTIAVSLLGGGVLAVMGMLMTDPMLQLTNVPESLRAQSAVYVRIFCSGIPFLTLYNFGSAILRAVGDTRRPLYFLVFSGTTNVILNLILVICFQLDVVGVAVATLVSNAIAAVLVFRVLLHSTESYRVKLSLIRITPAMLRDILWIGLPAGIQSAFFSVSNVIIQSAVNRLGEDAIAGNGASALLEGFVYMGSYVYHQTAISFVGQNLGGRKPYRIVQSVLYCLLCVFVLNVVMGYGFLFARNMLLGIFNLSPAELEFGSIRMFYLFTIYFTVGMMDVVSGSLRGLGYSIVSAVVTLMGVCVLRVGWVWLIFPRYETYQCLLISYPISWTLTAIVNGLIVVFVVRGLFKKHPHDPHRLTHESLLHT